MKSVGIKLRVLQAVNYARPASRLLGTAGSNRLIPDNTTLGPFQPGDLQVYVWQPNDGLLLQDLT